MFSKLVAFKNKPLFRMVLLALLLALLMMALAACGSTESEPEPETVPDAAVEEPVAEEPVVEEPAMDRSSATLAIEHFSVIEGTTWSGAQDRAGKRLAEKYPNVDYIFREEVGPDLSVPYAEEMIANGADIVVGNAEFMGMPLIDLADWLTCAVLLKRISA